MHELSVAAAIVAQATAHAAGARVTKVSLRIGRLSCVHEEALRGALRLSTPGTALAGATIEVTAVPVRVWCPACAVEGELAGLCPLACPNCGRPTGEIRAGRELDIDSIEVEDDTPEESSP